ncbi:YfjI family protein [uncultured Sphingomonas sp.]|uniref:YfjI family protein n=1 Tax=uncultured Sphingomonas sp. TaxID=158754 RepID=UPI0025D520E6|nr:YfjI family protein [uncultured Sphingomonas sp.]
MTDANNAVRIEDAPVFTAWEKPEPLPSGLPPVALFDRDLLPDALRDWAMDIADRMQCPPDMVGATAMAAAGAVLGRKIGVRPQAQTDWTEWPNLWCCVVGRPGAMKSPAMSEALAPLKKLEVNARHVHDSALQVWQEGDLARKARENAIKKELQGRFADDINANVSDIQVLSDNPPTLRRYIVNDSTYQALGPLLIENQNGLVYFRDELASLWRYLDKEENSEARGFYLQAWNGADSYTFDRILRGPNIHIPSLTLSLVGSTQPGKIQEYAARALGGGSGDDGLLQRFQLLVWPDQSRAWFDTDRPADSEARRKAFDAFAHMDRLTAEAAGAERDSIDSDKPFLRLAPEALTLFRGWREKMEGRLRSDDLHKAMESHLAKYRKLVPALALIDHLCDGGTGPIGEQSMTRAIRWANYLESHAARLYGAAASAVTDGANLIVVRVRQGKLPATFKARDVSKKGWAGLPDTRTVNVAMDLLEEYGWASRQAIGAGPSGGRPTEEWTINPQCLE